MTIKYNTPNDMEAMMYVLVDAITEEGLDELMEDKEWLTEDGTDVEER